MVVKEEIHRELILNTSQSAPVFPQINQALNETTCRQRMPTGQF